jgi:hypothetical protein
MRAISSAPRLSCMSQSFVVNSELKICCCRQLWRLTLLYLFAANSPTEVAFFTLLKEELRRVSEFYLQFESDMLASYKVSGCCSQCSALLKTPTIVLPAGHGHQAQCIQGEPQNCVICPRCIIGACLEAGWMCQIELKRTPATHLYCLSDSPCCGLQARLRTADQSEAMGMLGDVVQFYMDLLLLENFAVINYCGFGKILKKHDKLTGYVTKAAYMQRMVNPQEFTHYPKLLRMLRHTEQSYQLLLHTYPTEARPTLLSSENRLRLQQLEKVKAHSAAQKQTESSAGVSQGSAAVPDGSCSPSSVGGSDVPRGSAGSVPPNADSQSALGASVSQAAGQQATKAHSLSPTSRQVDAVELSAAHALVAVAADAMAKDSSCPGHPTADNAGYRQPSIVSATSRHNHLRVSTGLPHSATYSVASFSPSHAFGQAAASQGGPYMFMQPPPNANIHPDAAYAYAAHSGRSVHSTHSHHSSQAPHPQPGYAYGYRHLPQAMQRGYEQPESTGRMGPHHPALLGGSATWQLQQHSSYPQGPFRGSDSGGPQRYTPGQVTSQLRR